MLIYGVILAKTWTFWLAFLSIFCKWLLKVSLLSNVTPSSFSLSLFSISLSFIFMTMEAVALVSRWHSRCYHKIKPVLESLFNKVAGLKAWNFIKNRLQHSCFPVKFAKFLRTPILKNICEWLPGWSYRQILAILWAVSLKISCPVLTILLEFLFRITFL